MLGVIGKSGTSVPGGCHSTFFFLRATTQAAEIPSNAKAVIPTEVEPVLGILSFVLAGFFVVSVGLAVSEGLVVSAGLVASAGLALSLIHI